MEDIALVWLAGILTVALLTWGLASNAQASSGTSPFRVSEFGARGDGATKDTAAVQSAIDACAGAGGGTVHFPSGAYLCGTLRLQDGVHLLLDAGATIKGSPDEEDYDPCEPLDFANDADEETSYFHYALIRAEDVERIGIRGSGVIDGNRDERGGPKPIALKRCRQVEIRGIRIVNAPNYAISLLGTDDVLVDGVRILNAYCDGIDPDSCRNVRIANCHIESLDDAIVAKTSFSLGERRSCENITVTNCYLATGCNGFKLGTESGGDFRHIAVSNCVMSGLADHRPATSGIALESVDGANVDGVVISNIAMRGVRAPVFLRLGNRGRDMNTPVPGTLKNVAISNVVATGASLPCSITGIPDHPVEGVTLANIRIEYVGGGPGRPADDPVPEVAAAYPDPRMFDGLPAYGLYCRHVTDLTLANLRLSIENTYWRLASADSRPLRWNTKDGVPLDAQPGIAGTALVCDDVLDLTVDMFHAQPSTGADPVMRLHQVRSAIAAGCVASHGTSVFLRVTGEDTSDIALLCSDLGHAERVIDLGDEVNADAVSAEAIGR